MLSRATLSAARFLQLFVNSFPPGTDLPPTLSEASASLQVLEDQFVASKLPGGEMLGAGHEAQKLFGNFDTPDGQLVDGNAYGIVIHGRGVLVNQFGETQSSPFAEDAHDVTISNTKISNVLARINEVVTIDMPAGSDAAGKPMVDTAGSVLRIDEQYENPFDGTGAFKVDALHKLRFEYQNYIHSLPSEQAARAKGTLRIDQALADAFMNGGDETVEAQLATYTKRCNGDSMHHSQKGAIGLFAQKVNNLSVKNVQVSNVKNYGSLGSDACGAYTKSQWTGHVGYTGSQAYGAVVTTSRSVSLDGLNINGVFSQNAEAYGAAFFNDVDDVCSSGLNISGISSGFYARGPNDPPRIASLLIYSTRSQLGSGAERILFGA